MDTSDVLQLDSGQHWFSLIDTASLQDYQRILQDRKKTKSESMTFYKGKIAGFAVGNEARKGKAELTLSVDKCGVLQIVHGDDIPYTGVILKEHDSNPSNPVVVGTEHDVEIKGKFVGHDLPSDDRVTVFFGSNSAAQNFTKKLKFIIERNLAAPLPKLGNGSESSDTE